MGSRISILRWPEIHSTNPVVCHYYSSIKSPYKMKLSLTRHRIVLASTLLLVALAAQSSTHSSDEDDWFDEDFGDPTAHVNEGELAFLVEPPAEAVHHLSNRVILNGDSRESGWVRLEQCHHNIDNVGRAEIVFHKDKIRNLRITRAANIDKAWVEGASVQLTDIGKHSSLCLEADSRALHANADGSFRVNNGPFMRRFLDGYYPMRVSEQLVLADSGLRFAGIEPARQPGFEVEVDGDSIRFDAWFEGRLRTEIELVPAGWSQPRSSTGSESLVRIGTAAARCPRFGRLVDDNQAARHDIDADLQANGQVTGMRFCEL